MIPETPLQKALNEIEAFANKNGYGMFETNFDEEGKRGDIHLIPCSKMGVAIAPHQSIARCECNPKLIREDPVRLYVHNQIS